MIQFQLSVINQIKLEQFYQFDLKMNFREPQSVNCRKVYSSFKLTQQPNTDYDDTHPHCNDGSSKQACNGLVFVLTLLFLESIYFWIMKTLLLFFAYF